MQENLAKQRIPLVADDPPEYDYIVAVDAASDQVSMIEACMLRCYLEYLCQRSYQRTAREVTGRFSGEAAPYPAVPGQVTTVFMKRARHSWAYCRGPGSVYRPTRDESPLRLVQLLDRVATHEGFLSLEPWMAWKDRHRWRELFQPRTATRKLA